MSTESVSSAGATTEPGSAPLIAVVHATTATIPPVTAAFAQQLPQAQLWHLLDDRLLTDAEREGGLTTALRERMERLIDHAVRAGADAVQLACSLYGPVAAAAEQQVPVHAADQALFAETARRGPERITVLASVQSAAADTAARLGAWLHARESTSRLEPEIETVVVTEARRAAQHNDRELLGSVLVEAARQHPGSDVLVLAQFSLSPALDRVAEESAVPVLSGPHLAADALAAALRTEGR